MANRLNSGFTPRYRGTTQASISLPARPTTLSSTVLKRGTIFRLSRVPTATAPGQDNLRQAYTFLETKEKAPRIGVIESDAGDRWVLDTATLWKYWRVVDEGVIDST